MCFPNEPAADKYLRVELRKGWDVCSMALQSRAILRSKLATEETHRHGSESHATTERP